MISRQREDRSINIFCPCKQCQCTDICTPHVIIKRHTHITDIVKLGHQKSVCRRKWRNAFLLLRSPIFYIQCHIYTHFNIRSIIDNITLIEGAPIPQYVQTSRLRLLHTITCVLGMFIFFIFYIALIAFILSATITELSINLQLNKQGTWTLFREGAQIVNSSNRVVAAIHLSTNSITDLSA